MAFQIPEDLHRDLYPVAWLLGTWQGSGRSEYPGTESFGFEQEVAFAHDGRDFLHYFSRAWITDDAGERTGPGPLETGFLRLAGPVPAQGDRTPPGTVVELVLVQPAGYAEVWYGVADGPRVTLGTDAVVRTGTAQGLTAEPYTAGQRMYGLVESDLMYAYDMATEGQSMQSHQWGRLARV